MDPKAQASRLLPRNTCFCWAMITTIIGHVANANGIDLTVTASAVYPMISILDLQGHWRQTFGYLAETNFAFYFLVIAPLLVFLAFQFLLSSGYALFDFERNGILRIGKVNPTDQPPRLKFISCLKRWLFVILRIDRGRLNDQTPPLKFISGLNHSLFVIPLYSPVLIIPACWYVQFSSLGNVSHGYPTPQGDAWELGHVQSPYLPTWLSFFNNPRLNDTDRLSILQTGKHVDDVASALLEEVSSKGQQAIRDFKPVLHFKPDSPEQPTNLALDEAIRHGMIRLHASAFGYPKVDSPSQNGLVSRVCSHESGTSRDAIRV
jgi:hypothetical protein